MVNKKKKNITKKNSSTIKNNISPYQLPSNISEYKKLDKRLTNREFKILLKPNGLDRHKEIQRFQRVIENLSLQMNIPFVSPDSMSPKMRNVYFFDTDDESLRRNKLILRVRETRSQVWTDEWCEVTFKCRSEDIERSWQHSPSPVTGLFHKIKFKEEILKDGLIGSVRRIYSHNSVLETVPIDKIHESTLEHIAATYPGIKNVNLPFEKSVNIVGGSTNKILEAQVTLGHIHFDNGIEAHCELAIWFKSVGEPIVGELAFAYRVHKKNRKNLKAHKLADRFFSSLQFALELDIFNGTTKTALVYGAQE